jgi:hypothetical protein
VKEICTIGGIPQPVYKIPLRNIPEEDFVGVEIPELLDRIIIGPTEYPDAIQEAFTDLLSTCGVENPSNPEVSPQLSNYAQNASKQDMILEQQQFFTPCSDSHYDTLRLHGASVQGEMSFARCISSYCTVV